MKRKSLCAFCLVLWVLVVCSILSYRIEEWMIPWVDTVGIQSDMDTFGYYLPTDALVYEEDRPVLYEVAEGIGWESGKQVKEVSEAFYAVLPDQIMVHAPSSNPYLHYASKEFRNLEVVNVTAEPLERAEDTWLLTVPRGTFDLDRIPRTVELEAESEDALLLSAKSAKQPFISGRAKGEILFGQTELPENPHLGWELYSLGEVEKMLAALPFLAVLLAGVLFSVGLWVASCFLSKNARKNRGFLLSNLGICTALLVSLPFFLKTIDLPSSLLPKMNIFEFAHYHGEFREIFSALTGLANAGSQAAAAVLKSADQAKSLFFGILLLGIVLLAAVIFAELFLARKRRALTGKHL